MQWPSKEPYRAGHSRRLYSVADTFVCCNWPRHVAACRHGRLTHERPRANFGFPRHHWKIGKPGGSDEDIVIRRKAHAPVLRRDEPLAATRCSKHAGRLCVSRPLRGPLHAIADRGIMLSRVRTLWRAWELEKTPSRCPWVRLRISNTQSCRECGAAGSWEESQRRRCHARWAGAGKSGALGAWLQCNAQVLGCSG